MIKLYRSKVSGAIFVVNEKENYCRYICGGPYFEYTEENIIFVNEYFRGWEEIDFFELEGIGRGRLNAEESYILLNNNII